MQIVQEIVSTFSRHVDTYDTHAQIQHHAAHALSGKLRSALSSLPAGPVLEIGCGTGLLTNKLLELMPDRQITVSDASPDMVSFCRSRLHLQQGATPSNMRFAVLNGQVPEKYNTYALIISSFTMQWFTDLSSGIHNMLSALKPGGQLFFAIPVVGSFSEWQKMCRESGVACTLNALPNIDTITACAWWHDYACHTQEEFVTVKHPSALQFFQSLRQLGADTCTTLIANTGSQLRGLMRHWDEQCPQGVEVTYKILYGSIVKNP